MNLKLGQNVISHNIDSFSENDMYIQLNHKVKTSHYLMHR